jgi:hypothetical protein
MVISGVDDVRGGGANFCAPLGLGPLHRTPSVPFGPLWRRVLARLARPHSSGRLAKFGQHSGRPLSVRSPLPALWPLPAWALSHRHGPALPWHRRQPRRSWPLALTSLRLLELPLGSQRIVPRCGADNYLDLALDQSIKALRAWSASSRPSRNQAKFGRPRKVDDSEHIATAKRMKADGHTGKDIAKYLGVSRATLYRYLTLDHAD